MTNKNLFIGGAIEKYGEKNLQERVTKEGNVIGCMLNDLSLVYKASAKQFLTKDGREIYNMLRTLADSGLSVFTEVDYVSHFNNVESIEYKQLANLAQCIDMHNVNYYFKEFEDSNKELFAMTSVDKKINNFIKQINANRQKPQFNTGFAKLDELLDGGLKEGLYAIGAMSSIGKTTFCLQIADYLAEAGHHVMFYSLEQSMFDLRCKSISRITYQTTKKQELSMTSNNIGEGKYINTEQQTAMNDAIIKYFNQIDPNMHIQYSSHRPSVESIDADIDKFIKENEEAPIVFIDYLQILKFDGTKTDKQNVDEAISDLKAISVKYHIPVIVISSLNRNSYREKISMEAFKESGGIEYGCDKIFGLQFVGQGSNGFDINDAKSLDVRNIELIVLKNRTGRTGESLYFKYKPMFNCYKEN